MGRMIQPQQVALVVEDDPDVRELAATVLEENDLKVVGASSAEEALHYLRNHAEQVALLFADVRLPCLMSGVDLAKTVSSEWPWVRTILTSGAPLDIADDVPGEVRFVPKPWAALDVPVEAERAVRP
jgi:DNA-binding NtrC family response regulator